MTNGNEYTVTSDSFMPTEAGDYCFFAVYGAGQDDNYPNGATLTDFTDECFTVTPKQPTITTQVNTEDPVSPGTEIFDTATLANTASPSNGLNGTITFTAYAPSDPTCGAAAVYTSVIGVTGNGSYDSNDGDANNDGVPGEPDDAFAPTTPERTTGSPPTLPMQGTSTTWPPARVAATHTSRASSGPCNRPWTPRRTSSRMIRQRSR